MSGFLSLYAIGNSRYCISTVLTQTSSNPEFRIPIRDSGQAEKCLTEVALHPYLVFSRQTFNKILRCTYLKPKTPAKQMCLAGVFFLGFCKPTQLSRLSQLIHIEFFTIYLKVVSFLFFNHF